MVKAKKPETAESVIECGSGATLDANHRLIKSGGAT
jgi:hypothetical protein